MRPQSTITHALHWRARRVAPALLDCWAQIQLHWHGALSTLTTFHASQAPGAITPEYADLWFLYRTVRQRQPAVVLEFGSGCSTAVMAQALRDNGGGVLHSVDADARWAHSTRQALQAMPCTCQVPVQVVYSPLIMAQEHGVLGVRHATIPDIHPNLIYLDGPELTPERQVAFDILDLEPRLPDDGFVIIDDRQANFRFLCTHLRRQYAVHRRFGGSILKTETLALIPEATARVSP